MRRHSTQVPANLLSLRLFGSVARGEADEFSDIDVLAVYDTAPSQSDREGAKTIVARLLNKPFDLAEYSGERIKTFFEHGHLFAWHLFLESKNLLSRDDCFFADLSAPSDYHTAPSDIGHFIELLRSVAESIRLPGSSIVYESGMAYLSARNVALIGGWIHSRRPVFSRYAPFVLGRDVGLSPPVSRADYDRLFSCRVASTRGSPIAEPDANWVIGVSTRLALWGQQIAKTSWGRPYGTQ